MHWKFPRKIFLLAALAALTGCGESNPFDPVTIWMKLGSPYLSPADRGPQQVIQVDRVSGCALFSQATLFDEVPGVWPVRTTRVEGAAGFVTFRALYSCAEIRPMSTALPYTFWDLQWDLADRYSMLTDPPLSTMPTTNMDAGSLIVGDSDNPLGFHHSLLIGGLADVEIIYTQDKNPGDAMGPNPPANPDDATLRPHFIFSGGRLNPGLPVFTDPDTVEQVSRCLVIDKIVVRTHDPAAPACP